MDEGWLCDKGRFGFPALRAADRVTMPLRRSGGRRFGEISWDAALDELERLARAAGNRVVLALSGTETVEMAYALSRLVREGLGSHTAVLPEEASPALAAFRQPLSALRDTDAIVVVGDDPVVERAPVVDLWIRAARRHGADIVTVGPAGRVQTKPGTYAGSKRRSRTRSATRSAWPWSGRARADTAAPSRPRWQRRSASASSPSTTCRRRRTAPQSWTHGTRPATGEPEQLERIGLLIVSGDEIARDARLRDWPVEPTRSSRSARSPTSCARSPISSCRRRATWSGTARWSTSRAARSGCAAR